MASLESGGWFHGYTDWYLRWLVWVVQVAVAAVALEFALGVRGLVVASLLGSFLLFRQLHRHVRQELEQ
ncbi:hypothetical protein ACFQH6_06295 [Halobacteriaceae archaeon GCM10025711]